MHGSHHACQVLPISPLPLPGLPVLCRDSLAALRAEIGWAGHLGLQAVLLPPVPNGRLCSQYAQAINQVLPLHACWLAVVHAQVSTYFMGHCNCPAK